MHETRNLILIILLIVAVIWAFLGWFVFDQSSSGAWMHRYVPLLAAAVLGGFVWYALYVEDRMPDDLGEVVGSNYHEVDGVAFHLSVRQAEKGQAQLTLHYMNRFANYAQVIIHVRPPRDSFVVRKGMRDLRFIFKVNGGEFGAIHQPIGVPRHLQGTTVPVQLAAVARFPRAHGQRLRSREGGRVGMFAVDWAQEFTPGVVEASGATELAFAATVHLSMPMGANEVIKGPDAWKQEVLKQGPPEGKVMG